MRMLASLYTNRNGLVWLQMTSQIAWIDILHKWDLCTELSAFHLSPLRWEWKMCKNHVFSNFATSILARASNMWSNGFRGVEHMLWSPSEPNILSWYLKTRKPPSLLGISWFCLVFLATLYQKWAFSQQGGQQFWPKFSFETSSQNWTKNIFMIFS